MAEQHVLVGGMKIDAVVQPHSRRHALIFQLNNPPRNPTALDSKRKHIKTSRRDNEPKTIHLFLWIDKTDNKGKGDSSQQCKEGP